MILPASVMRWNGLVMTLNGAARVVDVAQATLDPSGTLESSARAQQPAGIRSRSFIDPAHDRVEAGHDGHRVGDQVAGHELADRLEVEERRVVDAQPEGLVGAVAHRVAGVLAARALDRDEGSAGRDANQAWDAWP